ncbi:unnamed protein product, partial [Ascophyllum nodosum]
GVAAGVPPVPPGGGIRFGGGWSGNEDSPASVDGPHGSVERSERVHPNAVLSGAVPGVHGGASRRRSSGMYSKILP